MKCVICHGEHITTQRVQEELRIGRDIVLVPVEAQVCQTCGERYYPRRVVRYLEKVEGKLKRNKKSLRSVGRILSFE